MNFQGSDAPVTPVERSGGLYPSHRPAASFAPPSGPTSSRGLNERRSQGSGSAAPLVEGTGSTGGTTSEEAA